MSVIDPKTPPSTQPAFARRIINARSGPLADPLAARAKAEREQQEKEALESLELAGNLEVNPDPIVLETHHFPPSSEAPPLPADDPRLASGADEPAPSATAKKRRAPRAKKAPGAVGGLSAGGALAQSAVGALAQPARPPAPAAAPRASSAAAARAQPPKAPIAVARAAPKLPALLSPDPAPVLAPAEAPRSTLAAPAPSALPPSPIEPGPPAFSDPASRAALFEPQSESETETEPKAAAPAARTARPAAPARLATAARNSIIGMALAYVERLESLFSPVFFLGRNIASVIMALLHLTVPLAAAWLISHWSPPVQAQFWSGGVFEQAINFVGLWVLCFFGWTLACLLGSAIAQGLGSSIRQFQREGEKFFGPK